MENNVFDDWLAACVARVDRAIDRVLPAADATAPARLHQAMRYAALGPGKRVRAALVYAAGEAVQASGAQAAMQVATQATTPKATPAQALDCAAAAVELIHAYSLVHDDLPCMDDDALRRGRPTVHVQYDEATALLVGDALQALAFETLARAPLAPAQAIEAVRLLAAACGSTGMVGGQAMDCDSVGQTLSRAQLEQMHAMKTGALLRSSVLLGGAVTGVVIESGAPMRQSLEDYARAIGLAFQVADDVLDVTADTATLGKTAGKDAAEHKPTVVSLLGLDGAKALLGQLHAQAHDALRPLEMDAHRLAQLADFIVGRGH